MTINVFIQARIGSTRLPGKVLKKIVNKTILELISERVSRIKNIQNVVITTGDVEKNLEVIKEAQRLHINYFAGSEENVLDRFYRASLQYPSDFIIRITADCPLIDFDLINHAIEVFHESNIDILSISRKKTFPHGFEFEIFRKTALETAWNDMLSQFTSYEKFESVFIPPTKYMLEKKKFKNYDLVNNVDLSHIRITLDYPEDFVLIKKIYESLYFKNKNFGLKEILKLFEKEQDLYAINKNYVDNVSSISIEK